MKIPSLRARLTIWYSLTLAAILLVFNVLFYHALNIVVDRSLTQELRQRFTILNNHVQIRSGVLQIVTNPANRDENYLVQLASRYLQIYRLPEGDLILQSRDLELIGARLTPVQVRQIAKTGEFNDVQIGRERFRFHNAIYPSDEGHTFLVRIGIPLIPAENARAGFLYALFLLSPLGVILAGLMGWNMAGRALHPIKGVAIAARNIDIDQLEQRLPLSGAGDEVDDLVRSFNETLSRLENSVAQMKQFTASISHELRTPLTVLRGESEVALLEKYSVDDYRQLLSSQLEEFEKLSSMVNDLLLLANAEAGDIVLAQRDVDLSELVLSLAEQLEPVANSHGVEIQTDIPANIHICGDASWLERAVLNLIDNAIKFTPHGHISLSLRQDTKQTLLRIEDTGIGISQEALPHIFDRFYRAEQSRSKGTPGVGLGLALVRWIIEKHSGRITVESEPARGTRFTMILPSTSANSTNQGLSKHSRLP
ncbi:MAG: heavy metal sensor histidine kinase [Acidobacteriota bacterium]|nr:heavy metal sensor histidine kinase [Acidobacteriota bacterium]